jgi:outer membrane protein
MKTLRTYFFALLLAWPAAFFTLSAAEAQQALPTAKIVFVDFTRISEDSLVGKDVKAQLDQYGLRLKSRQEELQKQLDDEGKTLEAKEKVLSPDIFQTQVQAFQQKARQAELELQQKKQLLDRASQQAELEISRNLRPIIKDLMTARGANLVMAKSWIYMDTGGFDITGDVIQRLDQTLTTYKVNLPES